VEATTLGRNFGDGLINNYESGDGNLSSRRSCADGTPLQFDGSGIFSAGGGVFFHGWNR